MTISLADAWRIALAAILVAWPLGAVAQTDDDAPPPNTATEAPHALPGVEQTQLPPPASPKQSSIVIAPLGAPEGAPAGLLDANNGGLGSDIWSGTPRAEIDKLIARLPVASPVYSERELARRLLLTIADAPVGAAPHAFLTVRLQALMKAGFVLEAAIMAANAQVPDDPEYARVAADAILFAGHANDACSNATSTRLQNGEPFWIELRAYCYAVAGDSAALELTRGVIDAQGADDKAFDTLLDDVIAHKTNDPGPIPNPTSLHLFLLRQVGLPVNVGFAKQLGMPALVLALDEPRNSPEDRASAAEDVLRAGAVPMAHLVAAADAQNVSNYLADPLGYVDSSRAPMPFFVAQSVLRQGATHAVSNDAKVKLVSAALTRARQANLFEVGAGLESDVAASILPDASMREHAETMARALMLAGNADAAARWYDILDLHSDADRAHAASLQLDLNLAAPDAARAAEAQGALTWLAQQVSGKKPKGDEQQQAYAALVFGIYDALGQPLPPDAKAADASLASIQWPGRHPAAATAERLASATKQPGRKGEALLLVENAIGTVGPGDLAPDVTVHLVRTLVDEGVPDAARLLALDALLLYKPAPPPPPAPPAAPPAKP